MIQVVVFTVRVPDALAVRVVIPEASGERVVVVEAATFTRERVS